MLLILMQIPAFGKIAGEFFKTLFAFKIMFVNAVCRIAVRPQLVQKFLSDHPGFAGLIDFDEQVPVGIPVVVPLHIAGPVRDVDPGAAQVFNEVPYGLIDFVPHVRIFTVDPVGRVESERYFPGAPPIHTAHAGRFDGGEMLFEAFRAPDRRTGTPHGDCVLVAGIIRPLRLFLVLLYKDRGRVSPWFGPISGKRYGVSCMASPQKCFGATTSGSGTKSESTNEPWPTDDVLGGADKLLLWLNDGDEGGYGEP